MEKKKIINLFIGKRHHFYLVFLECNQKKKSREKGFVYYLLTKRKAKYSLSSKKIIKESSNACVGTRQVTSAIWQVQSDKAAQVLILVLSRLRSPCRRACPWQTESEKWWLCSAGLVSGLCTRRINDVKQPKGEAFTLKTCYFDI